MKITVANLSSNTLAVPFPLNVTLTGGKSAVVVLKDAEWKAVQSSAPVNRLIQAKMLALSIHRDPVVAPAAPEAPAKVEPPKAPAKAPKAPVVVEAPKPEPVVEAPAVESPVVEASEPEAAPAPAVAPAIDEKKPSKKKAKEGNGW